MIQNRMEVDSNQILQRCKRESLLAKKQRVNKAKRCKIRLKCQLVMWSCICYFRRLGISHTPLLKAVTNPQPTDHCSKTWMRLYKRKNQSKQARWDQNQGRNTKMNHLTTLIRWNQAQHLGYRQVSRMHYETRAALSHTQTKTIKFSVKLQR